MAQLAETIDGQDVMHVSLPMIGTFVGGLVTVVIGAVGALFVRTNRRERALMDSVRIHAPVPEVPIKKVTTPPTWDQFQGHDKRLESVEHSVAEIRREHTQHFRDILEAGSNREARITEKIERGDDHIADKLDGIARSTSGSTTR